jgi:hypothetical protein
LNTPATGHREGKTLVVVTHDPEIGYAGQRIVALGHGKVLKGTRNGGHERRPSWMASHRVHPILCEPRRRSREPLSANMRELPAVREARGALSVLPKGIEVIS